jgi:hypothetical protein
MDWLRCEKEHGAPSVVAVAFDHAGIIKCGAPYAMAVIRRGGWRLQHVAAFEQHMRSLGYTCARLPEEAPELRSGTPILGSRGRP